MQEDWGDSIKNLHNFPVGQATMDVCHSGGTGINDTANGAVRRVQMVEPVIKLHYQLPWKISPAYTDPDTQTRYQCDPPGHKLCQGKQSFREWSKQHEEARSDDYKNASLSKPRYIGVKGAAAGKKSDKLIEALMEFEARQKKQQ